MSAEGDSKWSTRGAPLDQAGRLAEDRRCSHCGYNLRGLKPTGKCPECAQRVRESLVSDQLRYADRRWLRQVRRGLMLLLVGAGGISASVLSLHVGRVLKVLGGTGRALASEVITLTALAIGACAVVSVFVGVLLCTACETGECPGRPASVRVAARRLLWVLVVLADATALLALLPSVGRGVQVTFILATIVVGLVMAAAVLWHLENLTGRSGSARGGLGAVPAAGVLAVGGWFACWGVAIAVSAAADVVDGIWVTGAMVLVGATPATLAALLVLAARAYRAVNRAWRDDPDRYREALGLR
ncbi:MAG: hypothetical protein PVJ57_05125 [Phycisphaerae bacterium]|jgi:hypothetical protein